MTGAPLASPERLIALIERFRRRRIAVVGDFVCDEFVHGDIVRVSREAPVLVLEQRQSMAVPGAAGNAVLNLRALDAAPVPVGVLGSDDAGRRLEKELRRRGVPTSGIVRLPGYATPTKSRILAGGLHTRRQQIVRLDRGARHGELPRPAAGALATRVARALGRVEGLLVADYGYGAATPWNLAAILRRARALGLAVTVDSRARVGGFRGATASTPNQEELELAVASGPLLGDEAVEEAGRRLLRATKCRAVLVTRGARGMTLIEARRAARHIPAFGSGEVADVTGAGDTVIAVFTLALTSGGSFLEAAVLSNVAAGLVVMKYGTATLSRAELLRAVGEGAMS